MTIPKPSRQIEHMERVLREQYVFSYAPQPEITTWELARFIMELTEDKSLHFKKYLSLSPEIQRHFKHVKNG